MAAARERPRITPPAGNSVFDDMVDASLKDKHQPDVGAAPVEAADAGQEDSAARVAVPAPRTAPRPARRATSRQPRGGSQRPAFLDEAVATVPLQVKIPVSAHWDLKQAAMWHRSSMTDVVTAMLTIYTENAEVVEELIDQAKREGVTLGEFLRETLTAARDSGGER